MKEAKVSVFYKVIVFNLVEIHFQYKEDTMAEACDLDEKTVELVEVLWQEALGELSNMLTVPVTHVKLEQVFFEHVAAKIY